MNFCFAIDTSIEYIQWCQQRNMVKIDRRCHVQHDEHGKTDQSSQIKQLILQYLLAKKKTKKNS